MLFARLFRKLLCSGCPFPGVLPVHRGFSNTIYLTFDDGPHEKHTLELMSFLKQKDIKATFFINGNRLANCPQVAEKMLADGHQIFNHTYSHKVLYELQKDVVEQEVMLFQLTLDELNKKSKKVYRPPQGIVDLRTFFYLRKRGFKIVMWSVDSLDSSKIGKDKIIENLRNKVVSGGNILFHDDAGLCIDVLKELVPFWEARGFSFRSIPVAY